MPEEALKFSVPRKSRARRRSIEVMIKSILLTALLAAAPLFAASAEDAKLSVNMTGIGAMSCARWQSTPANRLEGTVWIYGFWTGLNYVAVASEQAQANLDSAAIADEVRKTCAPRPSQVLASAAWATYLRFTSK
jgi:hypothetical protein